MLIDYRTVHHKGTHIVFLDYDNDIDGAVFSSLGLPLNLSNG